MLPLVSQGANLFNLCPFPDSHALYVHNLFPIGPAVWPHFPGFWIVDPLKHPKMPPDSFPRLLNCWPPKTPHVPPLCLEGQFVWRISIPIWICTCAKFGANRPSRLVAFSEFVLMLVRLFAAVRKNKPKNNIYTSKIIIPARTCRHQSH